MAKAEHFAFILDALDLGLESYTPDDGSGYSVIVERPLMFDELPPENVRSIVVIDGCVYSVTIEAVQ